MTDPKRIVVPVVRHLVKTAPTRLYAWWVQWWWTDFLLAAALVVILRQTSHPGTGVDVLGQLQLADRQAAYADVLQLTALFGGFSTVAFTVYLSLSSRNVRKVKVAVGIPLLRVWIAALVTPWLCAVVMVCCVVTDRGDQGSGNFTRWIAFAALVIVLLQMVRIVWIFYQLAIVDIQETTPVKSVSDKEVQVVSRAMRSRGLGCVITGESCLCCPCGKKFRANAVISAVVTSSDFRLRLTSSFVPADRP